jgi:nucleotide-binding universal stress UspA family protein
MKTESPRFATPYLKARHILVPTDFSPAARRALKYARPLARRCGARLTLLHVVSPSRYEADYGYGPVVRQCADEQEMTMAAKRLQSIGRTTRAQRVVRCGDTATEIIQVARELKTDLIVMAESPSALSSLQSRTEQLSTRAPCRILVVGNSGTQLIKPGKHV